MIDKSAKIHPSAIIDEKAIIGKNVTVGAFSIIGNNVSIDDNTIINSHVVIKGHTKIGKDNKIFQFASVGEDCQDLKYAGEETYLEIGDRNLIRESVTIHRGTKQDKGITKIGSDNLFMINAHIAHDCSVGNGCVFANNATLAGHVQVDDYVIIGGMCAVHQFCVIGAYSMIGGASGVAQDVPPYIIAQGNHCSPIGVNSEGLKRRGFDKNEIRAIKESYKILYRSGLKLEEVKKIILEKSKENPSLKLFTDIFERSKRGLIR